MPSENHATEALDPKSPPPALAAVGSGVEPAGALNHTAGSPDPVPPATDAPLLNESTPAGDGVGTFPEIDDLSDLNPAARAPQTPDSEHPAILPVHTNAPALTPDALESPDGLFRVRDAGPADLTFIDSLQKTHGWQVGFMPRAWLQKCLEKELVTLLLENGQPAAYLLAKARYKGRDDVGIIYQACVQYDAQRRTIGTALVEHHLNRFPETTKLVGLWCAQDLDANLFWRAMNFRPIAYRAGSRAKQRLHIYWQRQLDTINKPAFWYPESTHGGPMKETRQVLPLNANEDWTAPKQLLLPEPTEAIAARINKRGGPKIDRSAQAELDRQRAAFRGPAQAATHWWNGNRRVPLNLADIRARQGNMPTIPTPTPP